MSKAGSVLRGMTTPIREATSTDQVFIVSIVTRPWYSSMKLMLSATQILVVPSLKPSWKSEQQTYNFERLDWISNQISNWNVSP